jgi:hypothetical protein
LPAIPLPDGCDFGAAAVKRTFCCEQAVHDVLSSGQLPALLRVARREESTRDFDANYLVADNNTFIGR